MDDMSPGGKDLDTLSHATIWNQSRLAFPASLHIGCSVACT